MASDLISRWALIKELQEWYDRVGDETVQDRLVQNIITYAMDDVNEAEAVDAVEVVRCKDCFKRNDPSRCPMCYDEWYYDDDDGSDFIRQDNTIDDGFCHVGAKMDGGKQDAERND